MNESPEVCQEECATPSLPSSSRIDRYGIKEVYRRIDSIRENVIEDVIKEAKLETFRSGNTVYVYKLVAKVTPNFEKASDTTLI